jgi:hypothetical protein
MQQNGRRETVKRKLKKSQHRLLKSSPETETRRPGCRDFDDESRVKSKKHLVSVHPQPRMHRLENKMYVLALYYTLC